MNTLRRHIPSFRAALTLILFYYPPQVISSDISYACMQTSPDRAYGARVQSIVGLEENRRKN